MRIDGEIAGILAAKRGFGSAVLEEIAGHPVIFVRTGEIFDGFAKIAAVAFRAGFAGRADEDESEARVEGHGDESGFAVAGNAFDANLFRVHGLVGFEIVKTARCAPRPCTQCAPIVWFACLPLVDQTNDSLPQAPPALPL